MPLATLAPAGRRRRVWQIFGDDRGIELLQVAVGQVRPGLVHAEQGDSHITADRERLAIGAQPHQCVIDAAVARIEDVAAFVLQALPLHVADEGDAEQGSILAVVLTFAADRIGLIGRPRKRLRHDPLERVAVIEEQDPDDRLSVIVRLEPQPGRHGFGGMSTNRRHDRRTEDGCEQHCPHSRPMHRQQRHPSAAPRMLPPIVSQCGDLLKPDDARGRGSGAAERTSAIRASGLRTLICECATVRPGREPSKQPCLFTVYRRLGRA